MDIKNKKKLCGLILFGLLTIANASSSIAGVIVYGSEAKGYMVNYASLRTNKTTYDDSKLNSTCKNYASIGAKLWNNTGVVTFKKSKNSPNKMEQYTKYSTNVMAFCRMEQCDSKTGKIKKFKISYNLKYMNKKNKIENKTTACHEFGHAIGLADLYNNDNKKQIMYGIDSRTATKPSAKDIKGAKYAIRK